MIDCHPFVSPRVYSMKLFPNSFHPQRLGKRPRNNTSVLVIQAPITTFGDRCDKLLKLAWTWSFYSSINLQGIQCAPSYVPHDSISAPRVVFRAGQLIIQRQADPIHLSCIPNALVHYCPFVFPRNALILASPSSLTALQSVFCRRRTNDTSSLFQRSLAVSTRLECSSRIGGWGRGG